MLPIFVFGVCILGLSSAELSGSATSPLAIAPITQNNPPGLSYQALFLDNSTNIRGYVTGTSTNNGTGVSFNINIYDLPIKDSSLSPFGRPHILTWSLLDDCNISWSNDKQSTIYTSIRFLQMGTAAPLEAYSIHYFAATARRVIQNSQKNAKSGICRASTEI